MWTAHQRYADIIISKPSQKQTTPPLSATSAVPADGPADDITDAIDDNGRLAAATSAATKTATNQSSAGRRKNWREEKLAEEEERVEQMERRTEDKPADILRKTASGHGDTAAAAEKFLRSVQARLSSPRHDRMNQKKMKQ
ncbi:hypothetical protein GBF38_001789 [Nibea albiflora]|uniref:Uncharacterized protein n=1 Tax=Nibea albiflora TaxID=240163 RepID=A0ACB7EUT8_NIBAL|nr:hypothetical protein GBF38_001789 [Nibea albiflora]